MASKGTVPTLDSRLLKICGEASPLEPVGYWLPSGIDLVDWAIGQGYPCGRAVEMYGEFSSGKTMLGLMACGQAIRKGGRAYYFDMEPSLERDRVTDLKVDITRFEVRTPDYLEDALDGIEVVCEEREGVKEPTVVVLDSVASCIPRAGGLEAQSMGEMEPIGLRARLFDRFFRRPSLKRIFRTRILLVFLNQVRVKIGAYHDGFTTPGGSTLGFASSVRLHLRKEKPILPGKDERPVGHYISAQVTKNKVGPSLRKVSFPAFFDGGPDNEIALLSYLQIAKVIPEAGGYLKWNGENVRKRKLAESMRADASLLGEIRKLAHRHLVGKDLG